MPYFPMTLFLFLLLAVAGWAQVVTTPAPVDPPKEPPTLCELMVQSLDRCIQGKKSHDQCMRDLRDTLMRGVPKK